MSEPRFVVIEDAREHNLKGVSISLPRGEFIVVTGPSGSGKSSLVYDTVFAEANRRTLESLPGYVRQFARELPRPKVLRVEGLSPAVALSQKPAHASPRSTLGTVTEMLDALRVLLVRAGEVVCPRCEIPIEAQPTDRIVDRILALGEGARVQLLAPICRARRGTLAYEFERLRQAGFVRARIDSVIVDLGDEMELDRKKAHDLDAVIDRLVVRASSRSRIADSVELCVKTGDGDVVLLHDDGRDERLSTRFACVRCGFSLPALEPSLLSFNSPAGACSGCGGLGTLDPQAPGGAEEGEGKESRRTRLPEPCGECGGTRLRKEALAVRFAGKSIVDLTSRSLDSLAEFLENEVPLTKVTEPLLGSLNPRIACLRDLGLGYLSLSRSVPSLSFGELQRARLAGFVGNPLVGVLYILDEPSAGLHAADVDKLLRALVRLRDAGSTPIAIEHQRACIVAADFVVDMGEGAGEAGGRIVATGSPEDLQNDPASVTGPHLRVPPFAPDGERGSFVPAATLSLEGVSLHNLRDVDVEIPIGAITAVTGVSGSGKSSLVLGVLLENARREPGEGLWHARKIQGLERFDKVIAVDQSPIGRSPRSNPAIYTGIFSALRELYASMPEARARGYSAGRFSFNAKGGRCEVCTGDGVRAVEMQFLPDVYLPCETCFGKRYNRETLEVRFRGLSIADVLELSVDEAAVQFRAIPKVHEILSMLVELGCGYLKLGQSSQTLSGGEAQRIKLARELAKRATGRTLYVLDEPSAGLHFRDVEILLRALRRLRDEGNTLVLIEHNLDVVVASDWIVDLGPGAGDAGGRVVAVGTPRDLARSESFANESATARALASRLSQSLAQSLAQSLTQGRVDGASGGG